jgi:hypothetical protein
MSGLALTLLADLIGRGDEPLLLVGVRFETSRVGL